MEVASSSQQQPADAWASLTAVPGAGAYGVIAADPPWRFDVRNRATGLRRSADQHYATMTLAEMKALPLKQIAGADCWLMLRTTGPHLPQAFEVMDAWGVRYSSLGFVWVIIIETFERGSTPRTRPPSPLRIDTS